jgi:hypothetical protein
LSLLQSHEVARLVVRSAGDPAASAASSSISVLDGRAFPCQTRLLCALEVAANRSDRCRHRARDPTLAASTIFQTKDFPNFSHRQAFRHAAASHRFAARSTGSSFRPRPSFAAPLRPRGPERSNVPESAFKSSGIGVQVLWNGRSSPSGIPVHVPSEPAFQCVLNTQPGEPDDQISTLIGGITGKASARVKRARWRSRNAGHSG